MSKFCPFWHNFRHLGQFDALFMVWHLWIRLHIRLFKDEYSRWICHFMIQIHLEISLTMADLPHQLILRRSSDLLIFGVFRSLNPSSKAKQWVDQPHCSKLVTWLIIITPKCCNKICLENLKVICYKHFGQTSLSLSQSWGVIAIALLQTK